MDNTGLIAELEALDAPCRETDCLIYAEINIPKERIGRVDISAPYVGWHPIDAPYQSAVEAPRYSASLDAAMTLVPDGHSWSLSVGGNCIAQVTDCTGGACDVPSDYDGFAATPAIALCIAALKARAATQHLQEQTNDRT